MLFRLQLPLKACVLLFNFLHPFGLFVVLLRPFSLKLGHQVKSGLVKSLIPETGPGLVSSSTHQGLLPGGYQLFIQIFQVDFPETLS